MSFKNIALINKLKVGDPIAKAVLHCINSHANKDTFIAYPSVATISKETEYSERVVYRKIKYLVDKGFLKKHRRGANKVNIYKVVLPASHGGTDAQAHEHIHDNINKENKHGKHRAVETKGEIISTNKIKNNFSKTNNRKSSYYARVYHGLKNRGAS